MFGSGEKVWLIVVRERESKKVIDHNVMDNDQLQTKEHSLQGAQPKCGPWARGHRPIFYQDTFVCI